MIAPFLIDVEDSQYVLYRPVKTQIKGEDAVIKDTIAYCTKLSGALQIVIKHKLAKNPNKLSLSEFIHTYKRMLKDFEKLMAEYNH